MQPSTRQLCVQCDVAYTICLNYVLFCAGTHSCTRGYTHLGVLALCVYVCVCLHPGVQSLVCCDGPSSLLKFFSSLSILIECSLDKWLLSCLAQRNENSQLSSWHLIPPSLSTSCSFFWCRRRPQCEESCFEQVEQEYFGLPCCYTAFPSVVSLSFI